MKLALLLPLCFGTILTACSTHRVALDPNTDLCSRQAFSESFGGSIQKGFIYEGRSLLVVIRCHTSGEATSEPFVLVQDKVGGWRCLFHATISPFEMDATVEGDRLVLWRIDWPDGKEQRKEFMSYDLRTLDTP